MWVIPEQQILNIYINVGILFCIFFILLEGNSYSENNNQVPSFCPHSAVHASHSQTRPPAGQSIRKEHHSLLG